MRFRLAKSIDNVGLPSQAKTAITIWPKANFTYYITPRKMEFRTMPLTHSA